MKTSFARAAAATVLMGFLCETASAAQGEVGTGVPTFGVYAQSLGGHIVVYGLSNPTINFPAGCTNLVLTPTSMGAEPFKMAYATLLAAKVSGMAVRFYAHVDNGCSADYVQLVG